ncbi:TRAP transporter substrate-binding protein [Paucibacter sp. PLA-PC-4]|uniref:TRAP transporter substrate-binding protein n=1 Tax=Paucibacter sp. PLA-PC-4 TaxID=2993655 RepID=UPI00224968EB|nr:TRAP transporter substrate-binding protein [Paucibacter sp. PLA-PC-4]MCX2861164.1 TRAP transporter substrate-binding protein [Paucibacter sp. PLA-PC-4]
MPRTALRALLALAGALGASLALAQEVTLKVHHFWPPGAMPPSKILQPWCDKIAADSGNKLKCQIFPAMQLGGTPAQLIDQAKDGVVDIAFTLPGYTAGRFPIMEVFELPFMNNSAEAGARAAWDFYGKYGTKEFPGIKPLMFSIHDEGYLHSRDKPIKTLADLKGMKLRAPTRQTNKLLASLGATPVGMPLPAVADAVSKGTIDGFALPWEVIPSVKLHEMVKYHTETDASRPALYSALFILAMNQAKYDSLPADLKAVIDRNSGAALSQQAGKTWDESQAVGRKPAVERGNTFYKVPAAEVDLWIKASLPLYDDWVADMDKRGLPGRPMLKDAQDLLAKYKK